MRLSTLILTGAMLASSALAGPLGLTATGIVAAADTREYTTGWIFTTSSAITVTALGYFDEGRDGLLSSHQVGIFDTAGNLLVSTTVPAGTAGYLNADWRMDSIAPFLLSAGTYVIGGANHGSSDPIVYIAGSATPAPGITLGALDVYNFGTGLIFPTSPGYTYLNPNFEFTTGVPEPATLSLAGAAIAAIAFIRRKR
ncbi:MAG: PEP-CTERM sorting domain-containing protein [Acidobacteria bacterium]|nr:PEP-CTERM sorting domain-containing protein [Acidobacteriota bacterium]